jgi:ligand-binding sensor domain-containing protein/signal transduction histidine kinase
MKHLSTPTTGGCSRSGYLPPFLTRHTILVWCFFLVCISGGLQSLVAQNEPRFVRYTMDDGMSQNTVNCILQDSRGFMWFGTQAGLNRFDGYTFRVFRHNPQDSLSISNNWIWSIFEDSQKRLWAGTFGGGLNRFDSATETFQTFRHTPGDSANSLLDDGIWFITEDSNGVLWVGSNTGLNRFDTQSGAIQHFTFRPGSSNCFFGARTPEDVLWFTTPAYLYRFDLQSHEYTEFPIHAETPGRPATVRSSIAVDRAGDVWLGTGNGLQFLDIENGDIRQRYAYHSQNTNLASQRFFSLFIDSHDTLWAGGDSGLFLLDLEKHRARYQSEPPVFTGLSHSPFVQTSLINNTVFSTGESSGGEIWVGTAFGLNRYDRNNQKFENYGYNPGTKNSLSNPIVQDIIEDSRGKLWISTRNGLNCYDPQTGEYRHYLSDPKKPQTTLRSNYVFSLLEDSLRPGGVWVGTIRGGLHWLNWQSGAVEQYPFGNGAENGTLSSNIYTIYADRQNDIWVGTNGGVSRYLRAENRFDRQADRAFSAMLPHAFVYGILQDRFGDYWFATAGGLTRYSPGSGVHTTYQHQPGDSTSISHNFIICLYESPRSGDLWIGSNGGLSRALRSENEPARVSFQTMRKTDGLPDDVVYGIMEDDRGHLWVIAQNGLAKVDISGERLVITTFTKSDGLLSNEFNMNAWHRDRSGKLYVGGMNGFNAFYPENIRLNRFLPPVVFTDFTVLNEPVPVRPPTANPQDNRFAIPAVINELDALNLSWRQNVFSVSFAALNFTQPHENRYAYKMEGFDEAWIAAGDRRFATYTNLDPGEYVFRVKASNNDGLWNETGKSLRISIAPPPWRTWWAYLIYAAVLISGIYGILRFRIREHRRKIEAQANIERAKAEERERVRKKNAADFHDEAGHLLTKITLFLELARRQSPGRSALGEYLDKIEEHTKSLAGGMRDFIWGLDPEKDTLLDTLTRLRDFGNRLFQDSEVRFTAGPLAEEFRHIIQEIDDRRAIVFIFKEAMHNCLKHAHARNARLDAALENGKLRITFSDDGRGFSTAEKSDGYGVKNMHSRATKIGASLTVCAEDGKGATVVFEKKLPA